MPDWEMPLVERPYGASGEMRLALDWQKGWLDQLLTLRAFFHPEESGFYFLNKENEIESFLEVKTLDKRARQVAGLIAAYVPRESRILLLGGNEPAFFINFYAILYAGSIPISGVCPSLAGSLAHLRHILEDAKPAAVLGKKADLENFAPFCGEFDVRWIGAEAAEQSAPFFDPLRQSRQQTAFIQYTSGTEGKPRGVEISQEAILTNLDRQASLFAQSERGPGLSWLPFTHDMGLITSLFLGLASGERGYIQKPEDFIQNPARWLEAVSLYRIHFSIGPVFAYELAASALEGKAETLDLSSWHVACVGSEPIRAGVLEKFARVFAENGFLPRYFCPCYGMAETTLMVSGARGMEIYDFSRADLRKGNAVTVSETSPETCQLVSCGKIISGHALALRDPESGVWLEQGQIGDIWVSGPCVLNAYSGAFSRETQGQTQRPDFFYTDEAGKRWFRTGDCGFLFEEKLFVLGRCEEVIKQEGKFFDPYDLAEEIRLEMADFLKEGRHKETLGGIVVVPEQAGGILVLAELSSAVTSAEKIAFGAAKRLAQKCGVRAVKILFLQKGALCRTPNGKLRFKASQEKAFAGELRVWGTYCFGAKDLKLTEYDRGVAWLIP